MTSNGIFDHTYLALGQSTAGAGHTISFRSNPQGTEAGRLSLDAQKVPWTGDEGVTALSLTDWRLGVFATRSDDRFWLRGVDTLGHEAFACPLPGIPEPPQSELSYGHSTALLNEKWAVLRTSVCVQCFGLQVTRLAVFNTPGLRSAQQGWTATFGNATRDNRER